MSTAKVDTTQTQAVTPGPAFVPPAQIVLEGKYVTLTALTRDHIPSLWKHLDLANTGLYHHLPSDEPATPDEMWASFASLQQDLNFIIYAINASPDRLSPAASPSSHQHTETLGVIAFLDVVPAFRSLEVGLVIFSPLLQRTAAATEVHYLMLRLAFEGVVVAAAAAAAASGPDETLPPPAYRRVTWKCNSLNAASRRAAQRLGFRYEGTVRFHMIIKGQSRDSDFLSILDYEWPRVRAGLEGWLAEDNFDGAGRQKRRLEEFRTETDA